MTDRTILPERSNLRVTAPLSCFLTLPARQPVHRLIYRINIVNNSSLFVRLLARKWTLVDASDNMHILEAEQIFRTYPILAPGGVFSYGGMHDFPQKPSHLELRIAGVDQLLAPFISAPCSFTRKQLTPHPI